MNCSYKIQLCGLLFGVLVAVGASAQQLSADAAAAPIVSTDNELKYRMALPAGSGPFPVVIFGNNCAGYDGVAEILRGYHRHTARLVNQGFAVIWNDYFKAQKIGNCNGGLDWNAWGQDILRTAEWTKNQAWAKDQKITYIGFSAGASVVPSVLIDVDRAKSLLNNVIMMYPNCDIGGFAPWKAEVPVTQLVGSKESRSNSLAYCRDVVLKTQDKSRFKSVEYPSAYHGFDLYDEGSKAISGDDNGSPSAKASIAAWKLWLEILKGQ